MALGGRKQGNVLGPFYRRPAQEEGWFMSPVLTSFLTLFLRGAILRLRNQTLRVVIVIVIIVVCANSHL